MFKPNQKEKTIILFDPYYSIIKENLETSFIKRINILINNIFLYYRLIINVFLQKEIYIISDIKPILIKNDKFIPISKIRNKIDYKKLDSDIVFLSTSWYKSNEISSEIFEKLKYRNISLIESLEQEVTYLFYNILETINIIEVICQEFSDINIIFVDNRYDIICDYNYFSNVKSMLPLILRKVRTKLMRYLRYRKDISQSFKYNGTINSTLQTIPNKKKILFMDYVFHLFKNVESIISQFRDNNDYEFYIFTLDYYNKNKMKSVFNDLNYIYKQFNNFNSNSITNTADIKQSISNVLTINKDNLSSYFNYHNTNLYDYFKDEIMCFIINWTDTIVKWIDLIYHIYQKVDPSCIIISNERRWSSYICCRVAIEMQIPTVNLINGLMDKPFINRVFINKIISKKEFNCNIVSDYDGLGGYKLEKELIDLGIEENKLLVSGQPKYDNLKEWDYINPTDIKNSYNIPIDKKIILFTTQQPVLRLGTTLFDNYNAINTVCNNIDNNPDIFLIIKTHPCETNINYSDILKKYNINHLIISSDIDIFKLLKIADILIASFSTTIVEAMYWGIPVIIINLTGRPDPSDFVEEKMAVGLYSKYYSAKIINDVLENKLLLNELLLNIKRKLDDYIVFDIESGKIFKELIQKIT